jgi:amino acid adenylation domain-containing protein
MRNQSALDTRRQSESVRQAAEAPGGLMLDSGLNPRAAAASGATVVGEFLGVAGHHAGRVALTDSARTLTYRETAELVRDLAAAIVAQGGDGPVAILLCHEARYPAAVLGVLATGRPFVGLDAEHPAERSARIADLSGASLAVVSSATANLAAAIFGRIPTIDLDRLDAATAGFEPLSRPEDAASIIYTSGSTGAPKGVVQNHAGLLADTRQSIASLAITADDRQAVFTTPSLGSGLRNALSGLLAGATLHMLSPRALGAPGLADAVRDAGITIIRAVPAIFRQLADHGPFDSPRVVFLGGDRVEWRDFDLFRRAFPAAAKFGVHLGSTETSLYAEWFVDEAARDGDGAIPVGRPLPGVSIRLLDESGNSVPTGEVGEFVVESPFLSVGYWCDPEGTARRFVPDPAQPSRRSFRTGDFGRQRPDGLYEHAGREDRQVKIAGNRIEPDEVEVALRACDGVSDAAIVVRPDRQGAPKSLVAYIEPEAGVTGLGPRHVMAMAAQVLPAAAMPARIFVEPALPRLANFKIDRTRLAAIDAERVAAPARRASTALAEDVIAAFEAALGATGATEDDCLRSLGADSFHVVAVIEALEDRFGIALADDTLAMTTPIAELAEWIARELSPQSATVEGR